MNEADTRRQLIDGAIDDAKWPRPQVSCEYPITNEEKLGGGKNAHAKKADYVLFAKSRPLAVIEAKSVKKYLTEGLGQAKTYAQTLGCRFAYATNGKGIYQVDMKTGVEGEVDRYLTPEEMCETVFGGENAWRDRFATIPFEDKSGTWKPRYYQQGAIAAALEAITLGQDKILLTLATGTGKTAIAFQIIWKLFHTKWTRQGDMARRPRVLFLADRNTLADQALRGFSAFPEDALVRISPEEMRKKGGKAPKNGAVFFTIFQTFMTEKGQLLTYEDYPQDFFDIVIIDECHRGGANDESTWRAILEYFAPAVQIGLTATPNRKDNADTYKYFGTPAYVYSLKQGINDGFLTPFRVQKFSTTIDDYTYSGDDTVFGHELEVGTKFTSDQLDSSSQVKIKEREKYRVQLFMKEINQNQKTIVFCRTEEDALEVRDWINQIAKSTNTQYCARCTASESEGETFLKQFMDSEKTIPTILTTSRKLSTGVDVPNLRNIVLMRAVRSMIEFKQIIGRGTRLFDDKEYFTVYDFVKAYEHFNDPDWDGEPEEILPTIVEDPNPEPDVEPNEPDEEGESETEGEGDTGEEGEKEERPLIRIELAPGKYQMIDSMVESTFYNSTSGGTMSAAEFIKRLFGDLPALFKDEGELRSLWSDPDTRHKLLEALAEKGYGLKELSEVSRLTKAEKSDIYDVLRLIAYQRDPEGREERVSARRQDIFKHYNDKQQEFIDFVLERYVDDGVTELDIEKLPAFINLKYHTPNDAIKLLGSISNIRDTFIGFQRGLYDELPPSA